MLSPAWFYCQKDQPHLYIAQGPTLVACPERVKFKLYVLAYRCLHDLFLTSADGSRRHLRSADSPTLVVIGLPDARRSATVRFPWQLHVQSSTSLQRCAITSVIPEPPEDLLFWTDSVTLTLPGCSSFSFVVFTIHSVKCPVVLLMTVSL